MISRCFALALGLLALACTTPTEVAEVPGDLEYCAEVVDWPGEASAFEVELLDRINEYREAGAICGTTPFEPSEPLTMHPSLRCAARVHALDMAARDYVMHTTPEGLGFADRAADAGFDLSVFGETLAAGLPSAEDVAVAWIGRETECVNLMNPDARELGVGFLAPDEATFATYWVAVFGA